MELDNIKNVLSDEYFLVYLRKSRQDDERETVEEVLARHEWQLQEFAIRLTGHKIEEEFIYREVVSGETIEDRPEIKKVLERMKDPKCKGVIVIEPSRLTRGDLLDLGTIMYAFRYSKTLIYTPQKTFDLDNKYDRDFFERELLRGKDYVEYTKEILMRGRTASAEEGNFVASIAPYGYDRMKIEKGYMLIINEKEAELVRMVFNMYVNEGKGASLIAQTLNDLGAKPRMSERFAPTAIRQMLNNEVYIGKIRWQAKPVVKVFEDGKIVKKRVRNKNYKLIDGKHEPIISEELFNAAKKRKGQVTKEKVDTSLKNIYAGLIKCKKCGGAIAMRIHRQNGVTYRQDRYYCRSGVYCSNKGSNTDIVQEAILQSLKSSLEDFKVKLDHKDLSYIENHKNIIKNLEEKLQDIEKRQDGLYDFLEKGLYTPEVFSIRNAKLDEERIETKKALKNAKQTMPEPVDYEKKYYSLFEAINAVENPNISPKIKNNLLKEVIDVIWYEKDEADIPHKSRGEVKLEVILK